MNRLLSQFAAVAIALGVGITARGETSVSAAPSARSGTAGYSPDVIAGIVSKIIADAIPREYERYKDWGNTKKITTGLRSEGNFFDFDIHRKKTDVNHGVWKHYRVTLIEPEKNLAVEVQNLRSLDSGRIAFTLFVSARLHGWAQAKVYQDGVHLGAFTAEGDTTVRLSIDSEVGIETVPASFLAGVAVRPQVIAAQVKLNDFKLTRVGDIKGPLAEEFSGELRRLIEDELDGPKLVAKLNHSIEKHQDKLQFTPEKLIGMATPSPPKNKPKGGLVAGATPQ